MEQNTEAVAPAVDYKQKVEESGGNAMFVPDNLLESAKAWHEKRLEFQKLVNQVARTESDISQMFTTLIYELRKYYADNGRDDIWTADVGFDTQALQDSVFILNITDNKAK